jgi:hypothetical protein
LTHGTSSETGTMTEMDGLAQGEALVREAWYDAMDDLIAILGTSEDPNVRIKAATAVLDYTSKFGVGLNDTYIPDIRPARYGGEGEGEDD